MDSLRAKYRSSRSPSDDIAGASRRARLRGSSTDEASDVALWYRRIISSLLLPPRTTLLSGPLLWSPPHGPANSLLLLNLRRSPRAAPCTPLRPLTLTSLYPYISELPSLCHHEEGPSTSGRSRYHLPCTSTAGRCFQGRNSLSCRGLYARPLGRGEFHRANFSALLANNSSLVHSGTRGSPIRSRASITRREGRSSSSTRINSSGASSSVSAPWRPAALRSPGFLFFAREIEK